MIIEDKRYEIDEVFHMIGEEYLSLDTDKGKKNSDIVVDGFLVHPISLRYMTFYQKGTACAYCGKVGTHFKLCGDPDSHRRHFNLFADDGSLITKDHIVPKSKSGKDCVSNMQPMCKACNTEKGNYHPEIKVDYIAVLNQRTGNTSLFRTINKAAYHVISAHLRPPKKDKDLIINTSINAVLAIQNAIKTGCSYCGYTWSIEQR